MLKKFLGIFKKIEEVSFDLIQLERFLKEEEKKLNEGYDKRLLSYDNRIKDLKKDAFEALKILERAELKNKNIPPKMITIMQGNRDAYIKFHSLFLKDNHEDMRIALENLSKNTARSYSVLTNFFEHEAYAVSSRIKAISIEVDRLGERPESRTRHVLEMILKKIDEKAKQEHALLEIKNQAENIKKEIKQTIQEIKRIERSDEFKEANDILVQIEGLDGKIKQFKDEVGNMFASFGHALKRYQRISMKDKILGVYLERPLSALLDDTNLEILGELEMMKRLIKDGKIGLEAKKIDKTLAALNNISKESLERLAIKARDVIEKKEALVEKMKEYKVYEEIGRLKEKLKILETKAFEAGNHEKNILKENIGHEIVLLNERLKQKFEEEYHKRLNLS